MFKPRFKITHNLLNNIAKFEAEKRSIEDLDLSSEVIQKGKLLAEGKDVFHLAHMMGMNLTIKEAKKIASGKTLVIEGSKGKYLTNYRNVIEYIKSTQNAYYPLQKTLLVHLNKIVINQVAEKWEAKYRTGGEEIHDRENNWLDLKDEDIASVEVQAQTLSAVEWFISNESKIHPLILVPSVVYRLLRIAPFITGNKITTLSFLKFLFFKTNLQAKGFLPVIKTFDIHDEEYCEAWRQATREGDDITLWIERFVRNITNELVYTRESIDKLLEQEKEKRKQPFLNLNKRQLKILRYLQNIPQVKRNEYVEMMDVSSMTAYRDLNELLKKGLIKQEGKGRGTVYCLASR